MTELLALQTIPSAVVRVDLTTDQQETLVPDAGAFPDGIVVVDGRMYWTLMGEPTMDPEIKGEAGADWSARNGAVLAAGLDGSDVHDVVPVGGLTTGKQLASDGKRLYWSDREGCKVSSSALDGSDIQDLVAFKRDDSWTEECVGVAVDAAAGYFYWTQKGPTDGGVGKILRAPLTTPEDPFARTDIEVLWESLPEPIDLEIVDGVLYWTDRGAGAKGNSLNRAPIPAAGERGVEQEILADGFTEAIGLAVDEAGGVAYVSDLSGAITAVSLSGSDSERRPFAKLGGPVTGIVLVR